ncbi:MAG: hypothetical protein FJX66_15790 [Alphaproteobacteria bacterium]|nr:hypothetical protein [Alphaproteobacteria bacterium]
MSDFWSVEPEVAGELGHGSVLDTSVHPPHVSKLEYRFIGWLGDELLETFPCYVVTERLGVALISACLAGFELDDVDVVVSDEFIEMYPGRSLPTFKWLKVTGQAGVDDFGLSHEHTLVVSDAALQQLRQHTLSHCDIEEYGG